MAGLEQIDRFVLERVLGAGAFATVWLAHDPVLDLRVAIKVLADNWSRDEAIRRRFIDEARVLWQADSPRIVRVYHVGELDTGQPFFVMGWADRGTLQERMTAKFSTAQRFSTAQGASIAAELARGLHDVHSLGQLHRDLKPANVLLRSLSSPRADPVLGLQPDEQMVIADFGLARQIEASTATMVSGSPAYVAPEQAGGEARLDQRADIYPLGLITIELVSGSSPVERRSMIDAALTGPIDVAAHLDRAGATVPEPMVELMQSMVTVDPAHRIASAEAVVASLSPFAVEHYDVGSTTIDEHPPPRLATPTPTPTPTAIPTHEPLHGEDPHSLARRTTDFDPAKTMDGVGVKRSRSWMVVLGSAAVLGIAGAGVAATTLVVDEEPASTPSTIAGGADDSDSSVTTLDLGSSVVTVSGQPTLLPTPEFSSLEPGSDEVRTIANVAKPLDQVVGFYEELDDPAWIFESGDSTGEESTFVFTSNERIAKVTVAPTAQTASDGITRIEIRYEG